MKQILALIFVAVSTSLFAQGFVPRTYSTSTPYGMVPHIYYVPSPRYYYGNPDVSKKHNFIITLANDSVIHTNTKINIESGGKTSVTIKHKKKEKEIKYHPIDTKSIQCSFYNAAGKEIILNGIPTDTCWLFKTLEGKINAFSFLAEPGLAFVIAIQQGNDGPILPLNKENLKAMIGEDNEKLNKLIKKNKLIKAVEYYDQMVP
jgi:hypothetical protein